MTASNSRFGVCLLLISAQLRIYLHCAIEGRRVVCMHDARPHRVPRGEFFSFSAPGLTPFSEWGSHYKMPSSQY